MERIAVVDLGSNSVRMTITRLFADGSYRMIESARAMVRLSEGMGAECLLKPEPVARTLHALDLFRRLMEAHKVTHVYPVATAAVRQALNGEAFLAVAEARSGLQFQVITGEEEAQLDFLGVANTVSLPDYVMIDIGGASTEIAVVRDRAVVGKTSIPWGAVNLTERFELKGKPSKKRIHAAENTVSGLLDACGWLTFDTALPIVGLGGTIRALAKADRKRREYPLEWLHQYEMSVCQLTEFLAEWDGLGANARKDMPGIGKERSDILAGAVIPLKCLLRRTGAERILVSGNGIREGLFYRHLGGRQDWPGEIMEDVRGHSVLNIMKLHETDTPHARHVKELALSLFDQLARLHEQDSAARDLLTHASLLHDAGMHLDYYNHQQHGFYLILNSELNGFTHREKVLVALLCGMHRVNAELKADLREFDLILADGDKALLRRLSLILMLAEQLDRGESGAVREVRLLISDKNIRLSVKSDAEVLLELEAAALCGTGFEREYGRKLEIGKASVWEDAF